MHFMWYMALWIVPLFSSENLFEEPSEIRKKATEIEVDRGRPIDSHFFERNKHEKTSALLLKY